MRRLIMIILACAACDGTSPIGSAKKEAPRVIALDPPSDDAIERRLVEIYSQVNGLQDVRVDVTAGVVELSGETDTVAFELRAGQLAGRVEGVVHVTNHINQRNTTRLAVATWHTVRRAGMTVARETPHVLAAFIVFLPFLLLFMLLRKWRPMRVLGMKPRTESIVRFIMRAVTLMTGLLLAIDVLGIMGILGTLVGALGIAGVIAGFAFKDWLGNYLPGLILGLHPQFEPAI